MKKKLFIFGGAFALAAAACGALVSAQSPNRAMDIALQNITALAGEESGTPASLCYYMGPSDEPPRSWEYMCDSQTDSDTIYPCPQDQTFGTFVSDDRCTN